MALKGKVFAQDSIEKALIWSTKAAEQGVTKAQAKLGGICIAMAVGCHGTELKQ